MSATINIKFLADLKDFSTKIQTVNRQLKKHGKQLQRTGKGFSTYLSAPLAALTAVSLVNYNKQAKAIAQVEAGLRSTGGAVGYTSDQLQKMASDLQNTTLFGDEEILQGVTSQLLTFTNIANTQFARTQQAALDLATRLDGDLKSASIQLGKALNDPVANLSALSRSGIQFSAEQKTVIKSLVETNRLADAQTIILDELEKQYGGSAAAAAQAGTGGMKQLSNILGDLTEDFGEIINEALKPFIARVKTVALRLKELSPATKKVIVIIGSLVAAIGPLLVGLGFLMTTVVPGLITVFGFLASTVLPAVVGMFTKLNAVILANPVGIIVAGVGALIYAFTAMIQKLTPAVSKLKTFFNLIKSGGDHVRFMNLQISDQVEGMIEEDKATAAAAKSQEEFNNQIKKTADLLKNNKVTGLTTPTVKGRAKATNVGTTTSGIDEGFLNIPDKLKLSTDLAGTYLIGFQKKLTAFQSAAVEIGNEVGYAFENLGAGIANGLGLADTGFQGFAKGMIATVTKLIAMMLSQSIAQSIAGATASGAATGPAAIFTTPAFIATAVGGVLAAFAAIPKFATGGIVGGTSFYGDKLLAMVNSGEAIFNREQQKTLYNAVGSGGQNVTVVLEGGWKASGQDFLTVIERAKVIKNRNN